MGKSIAEKQSESWGKSIVASLSKELQAEFPKSSGFSTTNIWYMVQFYTDYQSDINLQPLVGEISWSKHLVILSKCKLSHERQFYILSTSKYGWSKNVLLHQIENKAFEKHRTPYWRCHLRHDQPVAETVPKAVAERGRNYRQASRFLLAKGRKPNFLGMDS
ncbi:MAG: DUF1016 N-terminal domain-containing protein [Dyadobacter fermentans]